MYKDVSKNDVFGVIIVKYVTSYSLYEKLLVLMIFYHTCMSELNLHRHPLH